MIVLQIAIYGKLKLKFDGKAAYKAKSFFFSLSK